MNATPKILITGGTGYVGGRLIPLLQDRVGSDKLRLIARKPDYLRARVSDELEIVEGDVTRPKTLEAALAGIDTAYYLIHSALNYNLFKLSYLNLSVLLTGLSRYFTI